MTSLCYKKRGFTLLELLMSLSFFAILSAMMYTTFNLIQKQVTITGSDNSLSDKGQRIMAFMEEDIRMIGSLLGPDARIPYCIGSTVPPAAPNVLTYTNGTPYDTLQFLTSIPVLINETSACMATQQDLAGNPRSDYFLTSVGESVAGGASVNVDAGASCYGDIAVTTTPTDTGRSLVTFDSLILSAAAVAGNAPQVYYQLDSLGTTLTFKDGLQQNVPDNSIVYAVRQYRYWVDTTSGMRNLRRMGWDKACNTGGDVTVDLIETSNTANTLGGVDGLKYEFTYLDTISNTLVTQATLPPLTQLKSITVWLLLRSDKFDQNYNNTTAYTLGSTSAKITLGPFNDNYRRVLLYKTVEVKNLASIS